MNTLKNLFESTKTEEETTSIEEGFVAGVDSMESAYLDLEQAYGDYSEALQHEESLEDIRVSMEDNDVLIEMAKAEENPSQALAVSLYKSVSREMQHFGATIESISNESLTDKEGDYKDLIEAVSLESKSFGEKVVDMIETLVANIRKYAKKLFVFLFDTSGKTIKRAEALEKKIKDAKGSPKEKTIKHGVAAKLSIDGKVGSIQDGLKDYNVLVNDVTTDKAPMQMASIRDAAVAAAKKGDVYDVKVDSVLKDWPASGMKAASDSVKKSFGDGKNVTMSSTLLGNKVLAAAVPTEGDDEIKKLNGVKAKVISVDGKTAEEFDTLSTGDMATIVKMVITSCKTIQSYRSAHEKIDKDRDAAIKSAKEIRKAAADAEGDAKKAADVALAVTKATLEIQKEPVGSMTYNAMGANKAALEAVELSLKQYGGDSSSDDDDDKKGEKEGDDKKD
jgi:hypothetical protein